MWVSQCSGWYVCMWVWESYVWAWALWSRVWLRQQLICLCMCLYICVCVCVCMRERESGRVREGCVWNGNMWLACWQYQRLSRRWPQQNEIIHSTKWHLCHWMSFTNRSFQFLMVNVRICLVAFQRTVWSFGDLPRFRWEDHYCFHICLLNMILQPEDGYLT